MNILNKHHKLIEGPKETSLCKCRNLFKVGFLELCAGD